MNEGDPGAPTAPRARRGVRGVRLLRPAGHLACLLFCLIVPPLASGWRLAVVAAVALAIAARAGRRGLSVLGDWRTWTVVAALAAPTVVVVGWTVAPAGAEPAMGRGLVVGAQMALRVIAMLLGLSAFAGTVSVGELSALAERAGLTGLGFALGVAVNTLPTVAEKASQSYHAIRLRGGFRRPWPGSIRLWLIAVVVASLRHAEDVVNAAEARAFSADRPRRLPPLAGWRDGVMAGLLAALGAAIVCW